MKTAIVIAVSSLLLACGASALQWIPTGGGITVTDAGVTACISVPLATLTDAGGQ
jgi:hypothetical protein